VLQVRNLSKSYDRGGTSTTALGTVTFDVADRQFLSILGPSGCGKSTLLRCIAGLTVPSTGEIAVDGVVVHEAPSEMVYIFQEYGRSLFPWRRLLGNVAYPIEGKFTKAEARAYAQKYVEMVGLAGFEAHYPWELSGGMQQRAAIARALAKEPKYLLMDEPFGALDAQTRGQLEDTLLRVWTGSSRTVLFVTHDIDEAIYLSDRVLVMGSRPGRIVENIAIELPRPRHQIDSKEDRRFAQYRRHLFGLIETSPAAGGDR
jgi:NitT/TauT family transport system ATP-binding protein